MPNNESPIEQTDAGVIVHLDNQVSLTVREFLTIFETFRVHYDEEMELMGDEDSQDDDDVEFPFSFSDHKDIYDIEKHAWLTIKAVYNRIFGLDQSS